MYKAMKRCVVMVVVGTMLASPAWGSDVDDPPDLAKTTGRAGGGPISPPPEGDVFFTVDTGPYLDTGCTFRSGGPLYIDIPVTRYVGETNPDGTLKHPAFLKSHGLISKYAKLYLPAYDVDYDAMNLPEGVYPERDAVYFNGVGISNLGSGNSPFLYGGNGIWYQNGYLIPIEKVKFPSEPGRNGQPPTPVYNQVQINIDVANVEEKWCTAIDWASLEIGAMSPIILVHGNASDPDFFERQGLTDSLTGAKLVWNRRWKQGTPDEYDQRIHLPWRTLGIPPELGRRSQNAAILAQRIPQIAQEFGVDSVHIIAHSKGGLDTRDYLANYYDPNQVQVLSLTTLATPHNGSILTDIAVARHNIVVDGFWIEFEEFPWLVDVVAALVPVSAGYLDLETTACAVFNGVNLAKLPYGITYNTVAGDADFNDSGEIDQPTEVAALALESPRLANLPVVVQQFIVDRLYQTLRSTTDIYVEERYHSYLDYFMPVIVSVGDAELLNDTLVTVPSGRGVGSFESKVNASQGNAWPDGLKVNHASVGSEAIGGVFWNTYPEVIDWIHWAEMTRGDLVK